MEESPKWGFFDLIIIYVGSLLLSSSLSWWMGRGGEAARLPGSGFGDFYYFVMAYLMQVLITLVLIIVIAFWRGAGLKDLGIRWSTAVNWWKYGVLGGILAALFILLAGTLIQLINPHLPPQGFEVMLRAHRNTQDYLILLLLGSFLAPLSEELFYRGMIYPVFRFHLGRSWGMAAAGAVFGLAHWDLWRALPLAAGGALLCYIYEKSGSILVSTLSHGIWNGLLTIIVYFTMLKQ